MPQDETLTVLNGLIETAKDGEQGFLNAAKHAHAPTLRSLFKEYSVDCARSAVELQGCVSALGGKPESSGSMVGALYRGWMTLKTSITADQDSALLEECERGEDHAKSRYHHAMQAEFAHTVRTILQRQYEGTLRRHDRIRDLRSSARVAF
jgi:uncharacterized protein (TIGR02284 family)